jgi:hypothetical protein
MANSLFMDCVDPQQAPHAIAAGGGTFVALSLTDSRSPFPGSADQQLQARFFTPVPPVIWQHSHRGIKGIRPL